MSSARQATSSPTSNIQLILIVNALDDYTKMTGVDLSRNPFAATIGQSNSPETILELLQERAKAFKEYRDNNRRLINCLTPAVKVIQAFSGILGEATTLVPLPLANALFVGIDVLLADATMVTSSYDALLELFECLGNFLKCLEIYTMIPPTPIMTKVIVKVMIELLLVLALATKQLKQGRFKKFAKKLLRESEIDPVLQRLDRLTYDEARITAAQTLGVVHGLVSSVKVIMEDGKASTDNIRQDLVTLQQTLNEINKTQRHQLQLEVQHWLSPPDPSTNQSFVGKARHKGTAAWFFESSALTEWKSRGSLLWIHGKPGSGKSTLLSAIIQDIERMHAAGLATMAYYYFDFRDVKKQDCYGLLSSLISQLAAKSDSCYNILSQLYSDNSRGIREPSISALKKCLEDVLSLPGQGPIYIIVDALDECPNFPGRPSARERVLDLIEDLVDLDLPNVHFCVASRPEIDIRMVLEPLTSLRISLHDQIWQKMDIVNYIRSVVYSDQRMQSWKEEDKQLVIEMLSEKADGTFQWAVLQLDRLADSSPALIQTVLGELPRTLDEEYNRTLLSIDDEKREYAQRLFRCLTVSIRPLCVEELAEIFAVRFDEAVPPTFDAALRPPDAEEAVMSACSSIIAIVNRGRHQVVQFSHFSIKEYLTSERLATAEERLSYYHILPEPAHTFLSHVCLSILLQLDDKIDRNTIVHFPLAPYAARHWVDHAQFGDVSTHIQEAMERLFDSTKPHFAAWVWLYDIDRHWIEPMSTKHPTRPEAVPLYYASLCGFRGLMEYFIATYSPDLNNRGGSHTTPLHAASVKGHLGVAAVLLKCGADSNSRDKQGRAPLHRVSQGRHLVMPESSLNIARFLVSCGADVNITDNRGRTPLHAAARSGYLDLVRLLHESGASLNVWNVDQETPLHLACGYGKLDSAQFLIDRGSDINSQDRNGCIPLQIASRFGHVDVARLLLDCGSDVNVRDTQHWTPLHYASRDGRLDLAQLLIDRGADVNAHGVDHWTALHFASYSRHLDIAKRLIDHGADVNSRKDKQETSLDLASRIGHLEMAHILVENGAELYARDDDGWTPFHTASYFGHLHVTKFFLERGIDVDIRNGNEETSLYLASSSGKVDVVRFLIEQGADIHVRNNNNRWNPVHIASHNGYLDVVHLLIKAGTHVDVLTGTQETPLALASREGKVGVGRFLIEEGGNINARDKRSRSPFHLAAQYGHLDMARLLLDHGVDANTQKKDNLWSSLHLASAHGHLRVAELLVQHGARVDASNGKEETPLHLAAGNGKAEIACLLIDHGASLLTTNNNGWTPLHFAARRGHLGVVKLLLQRGASVDALNKANKTAATLASENGQAEIAKLIFQYKAGAKVRTKISPTTLDAVQYDADEGGRVESLLEQGSNINARIAHFRTPLHAAAVKGKLEVVDLLIKRGAEVDPCDMWGWVPLHFAARFGHLEVSRMLIAHGANVNARNQDHWTPMHLSAGNGHLGIVKLLLERGADVHAVNGEGETPYQISQAFVYREIADLLVGHSEWKGEQETA